MSASSKNPVRVQCRELGAVLIGMAYPERAHQSWQVRVMDLLSRKVHQITPEHPTRYNAYIHLRNGLGFNMTVAQGVGPTKADAMQALLADIQKRIVKCSLANTGAL